MAAKITQQRETVTGYRGIIDNVGRIVCVKCGKGKVVDASQYNDFPNWDTCELCGSSLLCEFDVIVEIEHTVARVF